MPDTCVPKQHCGTYAPGYLTGGHPTVDEGVVSRKVCFHSYYGCCEISQNIRVRNCGGFYVYELLPTPKCFLRYCGDGGQGIAVNFTLAIRHNHIYLANYQKSVF